MPRTNLRELLRADIEPELRSKLYPKGEAEILFVIGEEGENILAIQKPSEVRVPLVFYQGSSAWVERAIQERISALLECAAIQDGDPPECEVTDVVSRLQTALKDKPLTALVVDANWAGAFKNRIGSSIRVYAAPSKLRDRLIIGVASPEATGACVSRPEAESFRGIVEGYLTGLMVRSTGVAGVLLTP